MAQALRVSNSNATPVVSPKTKGAQMLTQKVSTFEKSEHLSILTQYRAFPEFRFLSTALMPRAQLFSFHPTPTIPTPP